MTLALGCSFSACGGDGGADDDDDNSEEITNDPRGRRGDAGRGSVAVPDGGSPEPDGGRTTPVVSADAGLGPVPDAGPSPVRDAGPVPTRDAGPTPPLTPPVSDEVTPGTATLRIVNQSPRLTIIGLWLWPTGTPAASAPEILDGETLAFGESGSLKSVPCERPFDIRIEGSAGQEIAGSGLEFPCNEVYTIAVTPED